MQLAELYPAPSQNVDNRACTPPRLTLALSNRFAFASTPFFANRFALTPQGFAPLVAQLDDRRVPFLDGFRVAQIGQGGQLMPWGNRSLLFRDPEGNLINLFAPVTEAAKQRFR